MPAHVTPSPEPGLPPPAGPGQLVDHVTSWIRQRPWLALVAVTALVVWLVVSSIAARRRQLRLAHGAQQIVVTAPPQVEPASAAQFWMTVYGTLYRVWWRRLLAGTPHLAYEYRWTGRALTIVVWVPGTVAVPALAAAARAAWPATTVTTQAATAPIPDTVAAADGGALLPVLAEAYPLRIDHATDPLRQVVGAGTGLRHHEYACVQILARPATPRRVARLRRAAARLRTPSGAVQGLLDLATPGSSGTRSRAPASPTRLDPAGG